jgi:hypothetical protein
MQSERMENMIIWNINGTEQKKCNCGTWFKHWEKFSKQTATFCPVRNCLEMDLEGAHVQRNGSEDKNWYIFPLCRIHNADKGHSLEVSNIYKLVLADITKTCG